MPVLADLPADGRGHAERLGGLQLHLVMSWPEVLDIPRAPSEWTIGTGHGSLISPQAARLFGVNRCFTRGAGAGWCVAAGHHRADKKAADGQDELFPVWRCHAVFTDSPFVCSRPRGSTATTRSWSRCSRTGPTARSLTCHLLSLARRSSVLLTCMFVSRTLLFTGFPQLPSLPGKILPSLGSRACRCWRADRGCPLLAERTLERFMQLPVF